MLARINWLMTLKIENKQMQNPVVSIGAIDGFDMTRGDSQRFGAVVKQVSPLLGLVGLGCMHVTVQPGRRAFPFHNHLGNDEMFVILSGSGTYRFGNDEHPVASGDVCGAPKGGPDKAHQLINTGDEPLTYLGISTNNDPDVVEYPDSGKFAAFAIKPGTNFKKAHLKYIGRKENSLDYFDGETL